MLGKHLAQAQLTQLRPVLLVAVVAKLVAGRDVNGRYHRRDNGRNRNYRRLVSHLKQNGY